MNEKVNKIRKMKRLKSLLFIIGVFNFYNSLGQEFSFNQGGAAQKDYYEVIPYETNGDKIFINLRRDKVS